MGLDNVYVNCFENFSFFNPSNSIDEFIKYIEKIQNYVVYETYGKGKKLFQQNLDKSTKEFINKITDISYHGNPDKVNCPTGNSRKSIAMYYYSNGRPPNERKLGLHSTIFRKRPDSDDPDGNIEFKKLFGQFYLRKKNKI